MHNLFLGTKLWGEIGYLKKEKLDFIQSRVDSAQCPSDLGKISCKIDKFSFGGFAADEFRNWTLIFSIHALHDTLADEDMKCWRFFCFSMILPMQPPYL